MFLQIFTRNKESISFCDIIIFIIFSIDLDFKWSLWISPIEIFTFLCLLTSIWSCRSCYSKHIWKHFIPIENELNRLKQGAFTSSILSTKQKVAIIWQIKFHLRIKAFEMTNFQVVHIQLLFICQEIIQDG